jgi:membrane-associated protein
MEHLADFLMRIGNYGYLLLFIIVFLESFPLTFYLPGDSLLFTTGFLASQGYFDLVYLIAILYTASTFGYLLSYSLGEKIGELINKSNDRFWFKKRHLDYTREFYRKYGMKTLIIGRFVPIVRSFAPTLAGAVGMKQRDFVLYTIFGGFIWTAGVISLGYYIGKLLPEAHLYLTPIIIAIIILSFLPTLYDYYKEAIAKTKK